LTPQLLVALLLRARLAQRPDIEEDIKALVRDLKDKQDRLWTARARLSAFRCEKEAADCKRAPLLPSPSAGADWQSLRVARKHIHLEVARDNAARLRGREPLQPLLRTKRVGPEPIALGARGALKSGFGRYRKSRKQHLLKGGLTLPRPQRAPSARRSWLRARPGTSGCVTAAAEGDLPSILAPHQVWRYPCYSVRDVQIFEAVRPPPGAAVPRNCIVYSAEGFGNTDMAGGDLDGDGVLFSFYWPLVRLVTETADDVASCTPMLEALEKDANRSLRFERPRFSRPRRTCSGALPGSPRPSRRAPLSKSAAARPRNSCEFLRSLSHLALTAEQYMSAPNV
ncbi:unnamed protein product, partial [Effrenium voratum]